MAVAVAIVIIIAAAASGRVSRSAPASGPTATAYYGSNPYYYDDGYYDEGVVAAAPAPAGDDSVAYCMQTYKSYDPNSGTYLGYDGQRHPCP